MNLTKKFLQILAIIAVTFAVIYPQKQDIKNGIQFLTAKYFPCKAPITYTISTFDTEFGISKTDFLAELKQAEETWEKPIGLNLFEYKEDGDMKVNLIYDYRQSSTEKLQALGIIVGHTKASYDELKTKYELLEAGYLKDKTAYESRVSAFNTRQQAYNKEVSYWNKRRGAPKAEYDALQAEKEYLQKEASELTLLQQNLKIRVDNLNTLINSMNSLAKELNLNVATFNEIDETRGEEFEEGLYKSGPEGQSIDIYQYEDRTKLLRVLAHEFGHALGLEHLDDPKAIMYKLNQGTNEKLTADDLSALKIHCGNEAPRSKADEELHF